MSGLTSNRDVFEGRIRVSRDVRETVVADVGLAAMRERHRRVRQGRLSPDVIRESNDDAGAARPGGYLSCLESDLLNIKGVLGFCYEEIDSWAQIAEKITLYVFEGLKVSGSSTQSA